MEFLVNNERVNTPIGPDKNTQGVFNLDEVSEARVNTEVALLTSNDLLAQVVKECRLASFIRAPRLTEAAREEAALRQLKEHLRVNPIKKSAIIQVRYESGDPGRSVAVLQELSKLYLDTHLKLRGASASSAFFEEIWNDYAAKRVAAEASLARYKATHNIVSLPDEKALSLQREAELERQYADALAAANRTGNQSAKLGSLVASTPVNIVGERKTIPNQAEIQQLSAVLVGLENKRVEAASRYLPDDRFVKDIEAQISQTKEALSNATSRNSEEVSIIANPVMSTALSESVHVQYDLAGYQAQAATLGKQVFENRKRLASLDEETATYNLLSEDVTRLTDLDHEYRQKADAAKVGHLLDQKHISNVAVAEQAFASSQPTSPKVAATLLVGFLWSLFAAVGTVFLIDRTRPRVRSPYDLERALGTPVLAFVSTGEATNRRMGLLPLASLSIPTEPNRRNWRIA